MNGVQARPGDTSPTTLRVPPEAAGKRLDAWLGEQLGLGRRAARRLAEGARINGRRAAKGTQVAAHDEVSLAVPRPLGREILDLDLVLASTEDLLVLEKPAGLPSIALPGREGPSLAAWLAAKHPECAPLGSPGESGLVHRLDTDTSGLLLAARTPSAYLALREQFRLHRVEKRYLALVSGALSRAMTCDQPIGQHPKSRRRMRLVTAPSTRARYAAQEAHSLVEPIRSVGPDTLVRVTTRTGVRHQIRVHLAGAGYPLVGDELYGGASRPGLRGHLLHAAELSWQNQDGSRGEARSRLPLAWSPWLGELGADAAPGTRGGGS